MKGGVACWLGLKLFQSLDPACGPWFGDPCCTAEPLFLQPLFFPGSPSHFSTPCSLLSSLPICTFSHTLLTCPLSLYLTAALGLVVGVIVAHTALCHTLIAFPTYCILTPTIKATATPFTLPSSSLNAAPLHGSIALCHEQLHLVLAHALDFP